MAHDVSDTLPGGATKTVVHSRSSYFFLIALLLLALNIVGFAHTFLLRPFLAGPFRAALDPPGATVILHGFVFLGWISLFALQTWWIHSRRIARHRQFGMLGGVLAVAMLISGVLVVRKMTQVMLLEHGDEALLFVTRIAWGNLVMLLLFAGFVIAGFSYRRQPEVHKRLMLMATLAMMGQSLGRIGRIEALGPFPVSMQNEMLWGFGGLLLLFASLFVHDFRSRGRPHWVTVLGPVAILGVIIGAGIVLPQSEFAQQVIARAFGP